MFIRNKKKNYPILSFHPKPNSRKYP